VALVHVLGYYLPPLPGLLHGHVMPFDTFELVPALSPSATLKRVALVHVLGYYLPPLPELLHGHVMPFDTFKLIPST
jgi:hypothetical protein